MERVWIPSTTQGWTEATVTDYVGDSLIVCLDDEPNVQSLQAILFFNYE